MALVPWRPKESWWDVFGDLDKFHTEVDRFFNLPLTKWADTDSGLLEGAWSPAVDIYDSKDSLLVRADMPGMKKDGIEVSVHKDTLLIKGEKKQEQEEKGKDFVRMERFYGSFNRAIRLPSDVDADKVQANYKDGVLELTLPKKEEAKPKQLKIEIK
jgi:HSP20 family protein